MKLQQKAPYLAAGMLVSRQNLFCFAVVAVSLCLLPEICWASFTYLSPSPYLSASDSPFPLDSNSSFILEDFENAPGCIPGPGVLCGGGNFDAPGVRLIHGSTGQGSSVDSDDGMIDGLGTDGASATASAVFFTSNSEFWAFEIEFISLELGFLPTAVGFVLTDGAGSLSGLTVFDAVGNEMDYGTTAIDLDPLVTSDDRFIGVTNPDGISRLIFGKTILTGSSITNLPRIDHLQYGKLVPEPNSLVLVILGGVLLSVAAVRQRHH